MNNVLNNILMQCGLIVPLEETETDVLAKACSEYIGNESFSSVILRNWLIAM